MKKFLTLLLAALLAVSALPVLAEEVPFTPYPETIKITTLGTDNVMNNAEISYDETDPKRISANENVWIEGYLKYLNIDVERVIAEDATALNAMVNTMMASGDLPDAVIVGRELFYTLVENEVALDLTDLYANYDKSAMMDETFSETVLSFGKIDGKLMALPMGANMNNSAKVLWVRQDWLDAVNMTAPTTWDELCAVAKAFVDANLGGEYTLGIGFNGLDDGVIAAFDVAYKTWSKTDDGSYEYANVSANMREALLGLQKAYAEGLISKDFAVGSTIGEEVANGHCGLLYGAGWVGATDVNNCYRNFPSSSWIAVPVPTVTGERVKQYSNQSVGSFVVITENCENPEAVLKLIDLELYLSYGSPDKEIQEAYYSYLSNGTNVPIWNLRAFRDVTYTDHYDLLVAKICKEYIEKGVSYETLEGVPVYAQSWYKGAGRCAQEEDKEALKAEGSYGFGNGVIQYGYPILCDLAEQGWLVGEYAGQRSETMNTYWSSIDEALNAASLEVIMGADISVFDEAVAAWYAGGGDTITAEVSAYYQALE